MKRKLHFLLAVGIGLTASVGWLHAEDAKLAKDANVTFKDKTGCTFVYAQGNPVTVTAGENSSTIIKVDDSEEQLVIPKDSVNKLYLFGGSKNGTVTSTKITVVSGTISSVFGGGYGELTNTELTNTTHAVVSDTSKIIVKGGSIHNIIGGGLYYSKSKVVKIDISGVTMDNGAWVMCGGWESGNTSGNIYPAFEASTNTVESGILNITGGTFCYVAIGGTDGAKGYVKKAEANISDATIVGLFGNGSNGASDDVEGKITNCTFAAKGTNYPVEVAAINRGHAKNVKLEFDNCTFPTGETFCFIGGTSGWKKDYQGSEVQVVDPGKISYSFTNCTNTPVLGLSDGLDNANVEVTGAKVRAASFENGVDDPITAFKISAGKTWTFNNGLLSDDGVTLTVEEKGTLNNRFFANGSPVTITARDGGKNGAKIGTEEYDKTLSVFGGSLNASVENSNITMEGGSILNLFGGGYGAGNKTSGTQADVNVKTTITVNDGTISNMLVGGGFYYSKSPEVDLTITGGRIATLYAGGYDAGKTKNTLESIWDNCVNGVKTFTLTMTGGTITEGLGCGGGQGYAHTDSSYVKISNATLAAFYGVLSNGSARTIKAELENCTFSAMNDYYEFASVNRGKAGNIDFTFKGCSFNNLDKIYANLGAVDGWASSDTDGKIVPAVTNKVKFTFIDSKTNAPVMKVGQGLGETNIELTGAVAKIDSAMVSDKDENQVWHKDFTLGAGKTWTFNDGLSMASGVTLTKTGTLKYGKSFEADVKTLAEMKNALGIVNAGDESIANTINLNADLVVPSDKDTWTATFNDMGYYYRILKPVTINGNGKSISGTFPTDVTKKYVITADYSGDKAITINDLTIEKTNATALNITWPKNVILNNVTLNENEAGALNINSAVVRATNLQTAGNRVGVRIQNQNSTDHTLPHFELVSGTLKDTVQIAFHDRTLPGNEKGEAITDYDALVTLPKDGGYIKTWRKAELKAGKNAIVRVWANSRFATEYVSNNATVQLDSISSGLDSLLVEQTFANVAGVMNTDVKYATFNKEFTASALKEGLVINCEDAYLVTGKDEAAAFADVAKKKAVKQLTLANNQLAVVSAFSAPVINDEQSWNDAMYAEQNVTITKDGILNINVAMALDTVFMEEGAQLKVLPNTAVTAKAVQLAYKVTDKWKAFGFPFGKMGDSKTMTVKDASGTDVKTKEGNFGVAGETGLWAATVKADAVEFEMKSANVTLDSACLIAADRDSFIYVTSPAGMVVSLGTKEAPTAPTAPTVPSASNGGIALAIIANPNLYAMQLQGYAYILDESKNVFTQQFNPTVAPFQSYILADEKTTSTLRSLRVGETPTGNEKITPVEGYYVESGHGTITIRTAEPVQVVVADMLGRIYYNARVTSDGYQINLPAGIYAVNNQKVIVK